MNTGWQFGDRTMRGIQLALLVLVLASSGELGVALQCFTCQEPTGVSGCVATATCSANETICKTTLYSLDLVYPFLGDATVTKSCASKCVPSDVDGIGVSRPVLCCNTELCNMGVGGAPAVHSPGGLVFVLMLIPLLCRLL